MVGVMLGLNMVGLIICYGLLSKSQKGIIGKATTLKQSEPLKMSGAGFIDWQTKLRKFWDRGDVRALVVTIIIGAIVVPGIYFSKREEPAPAEAPKIEAPVAQPVPVGNDAAHAPSSVVDSAEAYFDRGSNCIHLGQHQHAIDNYNQAISLKPDYTEAYIERGMAYIGLGLYQRAIEDSNKAISLKPDYYIAYWLRGVTYSNIGQYQRAIEDYNEAIRLQPDSAGAYASRGSAYTYLSKYNKAQEDFDKAISLEPDNSSAYYGYACMFALQKDATQACNWLRLAIERGYKNWKHIKEDKDFDNIRNTTCFIDLLKKSEK